MNNEINAFLKAIDNAIDKVDSGKRGVVTIPLADYEGLVAANTMLGVLQDAFVSLESYDFAKVAGVILGEPEEKGPKPEA